MHKYSVAKTVRAQPKMKILQQFCYFFDAEFREFRRKNEERIL
jgi:hypothetical protein